jgi:glucose-6-phosphate 1-dehydrogenase
MNGQQRLFARTDGVEAAWRIVAPVLADHAPAHARDLVIEWRGTEVAACCRCPSSA